MAVPATLLRRALAPADADADLLARFRDGRDEAAFAELVRRHGPAVARVCRRLAGPAADDAAQATFLVLAAHPDRIRAAGAVGGWLVGVAGRVARQMRAAAWRRTAIEEKAQPHDSAEQIDGEALRVLDDELTRLPEKWRNPVVLCFLQNRTQEQAAAALGASVRTVRRRLEEAKDRLRRRLERRGVAPAVVAALAASEAIAAPPPADTVRAAVEFLAGRATTPAAVLAKGVGMSSLKLTASAGLATAAGLLIALGAVVADDGANARSGISPPVVYPLPTADPPRPGMPVSPPPPPMFDGVTSNLFRWFPGRITIQTAGGICVTAEDPTVVRVVAREAEYHLDWQSRWWFGKSLPGNPSRAFGIEVKPDATAPAGSTAFRFDDRGLNESRTTLYGSLEPILLDLLPRELTRAVVAAHLGPDAPQWAVRGIVTLAESVGAQAVRDGYCRQSLNAGSGVRLKAFFNRTGGPQDDPVSNAQAHSVTRFLLTRNATGGEAAASSTPVGSDLSQIHADRRKRFLACVQAGPKDGWELAVKDAYGFPSLDQLEEAWIAWLRTPAAHPTLAPVPKPSPPVPEPARIPAVDVSAGRKP